MIDTIDVSDIGWDTFRDNNYGDFIIYLKSKHSDKLFYVARVSIPELEDCSKKQDLVITRWIIEKYGQSDNDFRADGEFLDKEAFISKLSQMYPEDLTWLLFHSEWLA